MGSLDQVAAKELEICENIIKVNGPIACLPRKNLPDFVERSLLLHRNLIERWGGCVWTGHGMNSSGEVSNDVDYRYAEAAAVWRELRAQDPHAVLEVYNKVGDGIYGRPQGFLLDKLLDEHKLYNVDTLYGRVAGISGKIPARNGQRISSLIGRLVAHIRAENDLKNNAEYRRCAEAWEDMLKKLGERVWASRVTPVALKLSVRPSHFLSLGNLNEGGSCYANGHQHDSSKVYLAADVPDSFVVLIYRGRGNIEEMNHAEYAPQGRAWGIAVPGKGAVFTNFYRVGKALVVQNILEACEKALGIASPKPFKADALAVRNHNAAFYTNADVTYYAPEGGTKGPEVSAYLLDVLGYSQVAGKFTNNGAGPAPLPGLRARDVRELRQVLANDGFGNIVPVPNPQYDPNFKPPPPPEQPKPKPPKLWPYKDFDLMLGPMKADQLNLKDIKQEPEPKKPLRDRPIGDWFEPDPGPF